MLFIIGSLKMSLYRHSIENKRIVYDEFLRAINTLKGETKVSGPEQYDKVVKLHFSRFYPLEINPMISQDNGSTYVNGCLCSRVIPSLPVFLLNLFGLSSSILYRAEKSFVDRLDAEFNKSYG